MESLQRLANFKIVQQSLLVMTLASSIINLVMLVEAVKDMIMQAVIKKQTTWSTVEANSLHMSQSKSLN
jgi:hypothetical protein